MRYALLNRNYSARSPLDPLYAPETNGNPGNYYIAYTIEKMYGLTDKNTLFVNSPGMCSSRDFYRFRTELPNLSHVFLILQDYLRETYETDPEGEDTWYDHVSRYVANIDPAKTRLVVMSLCANALAPFPQPYDLSVMSKLSSIKRRLFELLGERAYSIGTRGEITSQILSQSGIHNSVAIGDPALFEGGPDREVHSINWEDKTKKIGLTGKLIHAFPHLDAHCYLQAEEDLPLIAELQDPKSPASLSGRYHYFINPEKWKTHIRKNCSCVIGTRLHGAIIAMNAGVPAIVTNTDMRAKETCAFMDIPLVAEEPTFIFREGLRALFGNINLDKLNQTYKKRYSAFTEWSRQISDSVKGER